MAPSNGDNSFFFFLDIFTPLFVRRRSKFRLFCPGMFLFFVPGMFLFFCPGMFLFFVPGILLVLFVPAHQRSHGKSVDFLAFSPPLAAHMFCLLLVRHSQVQFD